MKREVAGHGRFLHTEAGLVERGALTRLFSSIWVPLFQASEKMELTTLWERAWLEDVPSDRPLSVTLEWLD